MRLYWENFDTVINELWRLLGAPLINFFILMLIFQGIVTSQFSTESLSGDFFDQMGASLKNIKGTSFENVVLLIKSALSSSGVNSENVNLLAIYTLIPFAITIFLLDNLVRFIGRNLRVEYTVVPEKIVRHTLLEAQFQKCLSLIELDLQEKEENKKVYRWKRYYNFHRYDAWKIISTFLDKQTDLSEYPSIKKAIQNRISSYNSYFEYINTYFLLSVSSFLVSSIYNPKFSSAFLFIITIIILISIGRIFYVQLFWSYLDLIDKDLETYRSIKYTRLIKGKPRRFKPDTILRRHSCFYFGPIGERARPVVKFVREKYAVLLRLFRQARATFLKLLSETFIKLWKQVKRALSKLHKIFNPSIKEVSSKSTSTPPTSP